MQKHRATEKEWDSVIALNRPHLRRFFCNVDVLCKLQYGSRNKALIALAAKGFTGQSGTVKRYVDGVYTDSRLSNLNKWCLLFNVDLVVMLTVDFSKDSAPS